MDTEIQENKDELRAQLDQDVKAFLKSGGKIRCLGADAYKHDAAKLNRKQWLQQAKAQTHARHYESKSRGGV
jgi:hypothetical protein